MSRILSILLMNNPRDFLPAKYKKNQSSEDIGDSFSAKDNSLDKIDSPWSDLAKKPEVPSYRSVLPVERKVEEKDQTPVYSPMSDNLAKEEPVKNTFIPKKRPNTKLAGLLVVFFLVIGLFSSYLLSEEGQDNRQQASSSCKAGTPYCVCGNSGCQIVPPTTITPPPVLEDRFGWCGTCNPERPATEADWASTSLQISGTYLWKNPATGIIERYVIDLPSTHEAATLYGTNWPGVNDYIEDPDGVGDVEIAPFLMCGTGNGYNTTNCTDNASCLIVEDGRCYLTTTAYQEQFLDQGYTWVPDGTGCGEGATVGGIATDSIDCVEYHFTTCLNQGSGVNGYGCDVEETNNNDDDTPTSTPPITLTTTVTQPPTVTTTAPGPVCSNIELLDSTGNVMAGDDDESLKSGDQIRLRATATNTSSAVVTYEFRIWAPNMSSWTNLTNTSAGSSAANVSAVYTINSSGHFVAQSRICVSGVCQAWETVAGSPSSTQTGSACTTDANCSSGYYCYIDPTPSGAQTLVAPTGNYCKVIK